VIQQKITLLTKIQYPLLFFIAARASVFGQENSLKKLSFMKKKNYNLLKKNQIILLVRKTGPSLTKYRAYIKIKMKNTYMSN